MERNGFQLYTLLDNHHHHHQQHHHHQLSSSTKRPSRAFTPYGGKLTSFMTTTTHSADRHNHHTTASWHGWLFLKSRYYGNMNPDHHRPRRPFLRYTLLLFASLLFFPTFSTERQTERQTGQPEASSILSASHSKFQPPRSCRCTHALHLT